MKATFRFLFLFVCCLPFTVHSQKATPKTLLWKITGKGLKKPSYLYGTMHLQHKRLFHFPDSLYHAMETTEGFATEIDFREYMDSMVRSGFKEAEDEYLKGIKVSLDRKKLNRTADSLLKSFGIKGNELTKADLKKIRNKRMQKLLKAGEMPSIMDGYLYGLAVRQKKWVGGIEDIADQISAFEDISADLTPESVFADEKDINRTIAWMIRAYERADLDSIEQFSQSMDPDDRDVVLIRRNVKMARRMDSLSAIRSMLFLVGVAHLPGDSGVITLLRQSGFTVEPVFSPTKTFADTYAQKLPRAEWHSFKDPKGTYTVQMPFQPSLFTLMGDLLPMYLCLDMSSFGFYFSGQSIGRFNNYAELEKACQSFSQSMSQGGKKQKVRNISSPGLLGAEAFVSSDEVSFRVRLFNKNNVLYILMVGGMKEATVLSSDAERFLSSFAAHAVTSDKKDAVSFTIPHHYLSLSLPSLPTENTTLNQADTASNFLFTNFNLVDDARGLFYLIQVRKMKPGFYLENDSTLFELTLDDIRQRMDSVWLLERTTYKGLPVQYFEYLYQKKLRYRVMQLLRGGRVFLLLVGGQEEHLEEAASELFSSVEVLPYPKQKAKLIQTNGFAAETVAIPISNVTTVEENEESSNSKHTNVVTLVDTVQSVTFAVVKFKLPEFFWTSSDTAYLFMKLRSNMKEGDSLVRRQFVQIGKAIALRSDIASSGTQNLQQALTFFHRDTLVQVIAFVPFEKQDNADHARFFESFRMISEMSSWALTPKADELLRAMQSEDSLVIAEVTRTIEHMHFTETELPFLHQALLVPMTHENSASIRELFVNTVDRLNSPSTVAFIREQYGQLKHNEAKPDLLYLLAHHLTDTSYQLLVDYLKGPLPAGYSYDRIGYAMKDSLALSVRFLPQLLPLLSDTSVRMAIADVASACLNDSLIAVTDLLPYQKAILAGGKDALMKTKKDESVYWEFRPVIDLVSSLNNNESVALLRQFLQLPQLWTQYDIAVRLLELRQPVPATVWERLAKNIETRYRLYHRLKEQKQLKLFPAAFANRQALAEAELYDYASEDMEVKSVTLIGNRNGLFKGKLTNFLLYKVTIATEDGPQSYLGVAGPFDTKSPLSGDATGVYWETPFHLSKIGSLLKAYLQQLEE